MNKTVKFPDDYIVWDLETTGFCGTKNHLVEIGMMKVLNGDVLERKRWVLNHNIEIPEEITKINGMTKEIIDSEGMDPKLVLQEFADCLKSFQANITHNGTKFDIKFLCNQIRVVLGWDEEKLMDFERHLNKTSLDTAMMFKSNLLGIPRNWDETFYQHSKRVGDIIARGKYNLGVCCDELGVDRSKIIQHRALGDVELTHEIYKIMIK